MFLYSGGQEFDGGIKRSRRGKREETGWQVIPVYKSDMEKGDGM